MIEEPSPGDSDGPAGPGSPGDRADSLGTGGSDSTVGPSAMAIAPPPTIPLRRPRRNQVAAWTAAVVFAAVAGRFATLSAPAEFAVLGSGLLVFARAVRTPVERRRPTPGHVDGRGSLAWLGLLAVFLTWELFAFARGSTPAHPTLSILLGPLLAEPPVRSAGYLVWLAAGAWIAKR